MGPAGVWKQACFLFLFTMRGVGGGEPWAVCTFAAESNFRLLLLKTEVVGLERCL